MCRIEGDRNGVVMSAQWMRVLAEMSRGFALRWNFENPSLIRLIRLSGCLAPGKKLGGFKVKVIAPARLYTAGLPLCHSAFTSSTADDGTGYAKSALRPGKFTTSW
jgi:hypothetical protein